MLILIAKVWSWVIRGSFLLTLLLGAGLLYVRLLDEDTIGKYQIDTTAGAALYLQYNCQTCHGTDGLNSSVEGYPHLASQPASYLINQMLDIKYKRRSNGMTNIMWPTINRVSDSEIHQIGQYLARIQ